MAEQEFFVRVEVFPGRMEGQTARVAQQLQGPTGPVSILVRDTASAVMGIASTLIGTRYSGHHPERGHMKDSGVVEKGSSDGPDWRITFRHPMSKLHHDGARPHTFPGRRIGQKPYFRRGPGGYEFGPIWHGFTHPDSPANPFLTRAAEQAGLRLGGALLRGGADTLTPLIRDDLLQMKTI